MSESLSKVKKRIQTVESTKKITSAMNMVSSVKFRSLQREYDNRATYFECLEDLVSTVFNAAKGEFVDSIYINENAKSSKTLYVVVTSNLGLCGAYNDNVLKYIRNAYKDGDEIVTIGSAIYKEMKNKRSDTPHYDDFVNIMDGLSMSKARDLSSFLVTKFLSEKYNKVVLLYTRYINAISFQVTPLSLLPVQIKKDNSARYNPGQFEPDLSSFIDKVIRKYLTSTLYIKLFESSLCEQASRRNAMDNADKNAKELIEKLNLQYNKARQSSITQEIIEVVSASLNK